MMPRLLLLLWLCVPALAGAQLLSPGPLHRDHADLDGDDGCDRCHQEGEGVPDAKCISCHQPIGKRRAAKRGLHGRSGRTEPCTNCHKDHLGRDGALVRWPGGKPESFPHERTGFALEGAHARLKCQSCHTPARITDGDVKAISGTYLGLPTDCAKCHVKENPHGEQFAKKSCADCHNQNAWEPVTFDHAKTHFPLTGAHQKAACAQCHEAGRYVGAETACAACHETPHPPATHFFEDCDRCHKPDGWHPPTYPRESHKIFPLVGGHAKAKCADCHGRDGNKAPSPRCNGCHEDPHEGRLGRDCERCHTVMGFNQVPAAKINHDKTAFPLRGRHTSVACDKCHVGGKLSPLPHARCVDCHADPHGGAVGTTCENCHQVTGFAPSTYGFERHTGFPLEGQHRAVPCTDCHRHSADHPDAMTGATASAVPKDAWDFRKGVAKDACTSCHRDPHQGQFGDKPCAGCHSTDGWKNARFDHAFWPLEGEHAHASCEDCHAKGYQGTSRACESCHGDPHLGQFGASDPVKPCEACHRPVTWSVRATFDHAFWPLTGAHGQAACTACHKEVAVGDGRLTARWRLGFGVVGAKPGAAPSTCARCHENVHQGQKP